MNTGIRNKFTSLNHRISDGEKESEQDDEGNVDDHIERDNDRLQLVLAAPSGHCELNRRSGRVAVITKKSYMVDFSPSNHRERKDGQKDERRQVTKDRG